MTIECTDPRGHFPDNQGFCHECGIAMADVNKTEFYVCFYDDDSRLHIKNKVFSEYEDAWNYALTIDKNRKARVLSEVNG